MRVVINVYIFLTVNLIFFVDGEALVCGQVAQEIVHLDSLVPVVLDTARVPLFVPVILDRYGHAQGCVPAAHGVHFRPLFVHVRQFIPDTLQVL